VATRRQIETGQLPITLSLSASSARNRGFWITELYVRNSGPGRAGSGRHGDAASPVVCSAFRNADGFDFSITRSETISDSVFGNGDLVPQASLKWHNGVNDFMI
jgi:hypothetical protein